MEKKEDDTCSNAFLEGEKMALVRCDTNYSYGALFFWRPKAKAFIALWSSRLCIDIVKINSGESENIMNTNYSGVFFYVFYDQRFYIYLYIS